MTDQHRSCKTESPSAPPSGLGEGGQGEGLPKELANVLRDQSVIVAQDAAVFELIGKWADAHSNTPPCSCSRCRALPEDG